MSLFDSDIVCKIRQRMLQVWLHSYIYYGCGTSIIADTQWDKWANELASLIKEYPIEFKLIRHSDLFEDFDGSTGYYLAEKATPNLIKKAKRFIKEKENDGY